MRPSNGKDAVVNIFEPIPTSRITRAKIGDRLLSDTRKPVDKLTRSMDQRIATRYNLDTQLIYELKKHWLNTSGQPRMPFIAYIRRIADMTPAARAQSFAYSPWTLSKLALAMPSGALRTAFNKMETPMGTDMLKYASGDLLDDLENLGYGNPAENVRYALAGIASGLRSPDRFIKEHPYINQYYLKPLEIDVNTLYEL